MQLQRVPQEGHIAFAARRFKARWIGLGLLLSSVACREAPRAVALALGGAHSCALDSDGQVWCWGGKGQLEPTRVIGLPSGVVSIAAGANHTCAVSDDGRVWCWGAGERGQLGDGAARSNAVPVVVADVNDAVAVAAGDLHSCARSRDGTVRCWGDNSTAQIVYPATTEPQATPLLAFDGVATALSAGGLDGVSRTCVVSDGAVLCWGRLEPAVIVASLAEASSVAVGADHVCSLDALRRLRCEGTVPAPALDELASLEFVDVSAGALHTCASKADGSAWCFGDNLNGQLGAGDQSDHDVLVPAMASQVTALGMGALHSCAVFDDGSVRCWGENNNGRLGTGAAGGVESLPQRVAIFGE